MIFRDEVKAAQGRVERLQRRLDAAQEQLASARALPAEAVADEDERAAKRLFGPPPGYDRTTSRNRRSKSNDCFFGFLSAVPRQRTWVGWGCDGEF